MLMYFTWSPLLMIPALIPKYLFSLEAYKRLKLIGKVSKNTIRQTQSQHDSQSGLQGLWKSSIKIEHLLLK